jgi:hypothetical protein
MGTVGRLRASRVWSLTAAAAVAVAAPGTASSQTAPAYPEIFRDPPETARLNQDDLANLGRIVVLEASSMFVHARAELSSSPDAYRLLTQISEVWSAGDAFISAVTFSETAAERAEAARLTYPDLEAAYMNLRSSLGAFPGAAPLASVNLARMGRAVSIIGPILRIEPGAPAATIAATGATGDAVVLGSWARVVASGIAGIRKQIAAEPGRPSPAGTSADDLAILQQLVTGFGRIAGSRLAGAELVAAFRPIRDLAQKIDRELLRRPVPDQARRDWRNVQGRVDRLASLFQLPREYVLRPSNEQAMKDRNEIVALVDEALKETDSLAGRRPVDRPETAEEATLHAELGQLETRLLLLRQYCLAQEPSGRVRQAFRQIESAARPLSQRARGEAATKDAGLTESVRRLDQTLERLRQRLDAGSLNDSASPRP